MRVMRLSVKVASGFRRPAAADALFDGFAFCFVPGTCVSEDRFLNIFYFPYSKDRRRVPQKSLTG
jgi:hypothetical protein